MPRAPSAPWRRDRKTHNIAAVSREATLRASAITEAPAMAGMRPGAERLS
ncbi:hypothetical protein ACODT5_15315 [Streptomyces sp. 5.8]